MISSSFSFARGSETDVESRKPTSPNVSTIDFVLPEPDLLLAGGLLAASHDLPPFLFSAFVVEQKRTAVGGIKSKSRLGVGGL